MTNLNEVKSQLPNVQSWIMQGIGKDTVDFAEEFGEYLVRGLSTSQIRNVFGEVKRIQMKGEANEAFVTDVLLLKPKLAYAKARASGATQRERAEAIAEVLTAGIDGIFSEGMTSENKFKRFENFAAFFEAILAYHRANGGK